MDKGLLRAILDVWEIDYPKLKTSINERIKVQKLMHLLQNKLFGSDTFYGYNMYLYGPYSPTLSQDYYELAENPAAHAPKQLKKSAVKHIEQVKDDARTFAEEHSMREVRALELLGTTLFFAKQYSKPDKVVTAVRTVKKTFNSSTVKAARQFLVDKGYFRPRAA
ncbi:MAG: hypothetical protein B1H03_07225 [Planctomycetales bacterium 4484_113]|nr:MAG: hypothetical protein B1H03_07225 [Planctomycetales bacterium 4484_113]